MALQKYTKSGYRFKDSASLCGICRDVLFEPVCPSCPHAFCAQCLLKVVEDALSPPPSSSSSSLDEKTPLCPLCNAEIDVNALFEQPTYKPRVNLALRHLAIKMMGETAYNHRLARMDSFVKNLESSIVDHVTAESAKRNNCGVRVSEVVTYFTGKNDHGMPCFSKFQVLSALDALVDDKKKLDSSSTWLGLKPSDVHKRGVTAILFLPQHFETVVMNTIKGCYESYVTSSDFGTLQTIVAMAARFFHEERIDRALFDRIVAATKLPCGGASFVTLNFYTPSSLDHRHCSHCAGYKGLCVCDLCPRPTTAKCAPAGRDSPY